MSKIILVADDSVTMQTVAEITFRATDFTYVGARSADEAIEKARSQKPALVLADAVMGSKSGYDLCHTLKTDARLGDVPVVILCGNSQTFDASRGAQVGADGSLTKPWDTQVMLEKVTEFIDKASGGVARPGAAVPAAAAKSAPAAATPSPMAAAAAAAAKGAAAEPKPAPPRSATIMGMPTIKFPAGPAPAPATTPAPARTPAPAASAGGGNHGGMSIAPAIGRPPMISSNPTKRSALVEATLAKMAARLAEASGLSPGSPELIALLKLSTEVVERVVWEVVPELAEQIIRENLQELTARRGGN